VFMRGFHGFVATANCCQIEKRGKMGTGFIGLLPFFHFLAPPITLH
jgi:hypothetical protein